MRIKSVEIFNFRLLEEVKMMLEDDVTLIVGRNNSGKTSLTEMFKKLLSDNTPNFLLEDFSLSCHEKFWEAYNKQLDHLDEEEVRKTLPIIVINLNMKYKIDAASYGALSDFIVDLDLECDNTRVIIKYQLKKIGLKNLFDKIEFSEDLNDEQKKAAFFLTIRSRIADSYQCQVFAQDPNDETNLKELEWHRVKSLFHCGFINAQRGLDDTSTKGVTETSGNNVLGGILEKLFITATKSDKPEDQEVSKNLTVALQEVQASLNTGFNEQLKGLFPTFELFGYPGLSDPNLLTQTTLDAKKLLKNHTKVQYTGINGINLPEAYNGLGTRNLIYILLQLLEFYKAFSAAKAFGGLQVVFIEEPEAHLHPQMQEVFIGNLNEIAKKFAEAFETEAWPVQFIVTTHSSHMANKAQFESMRYFFTVADDKANGVRKTKIKDLKHGMSEIAPEDKAFLHQYMTLTRCDLLFADKVVLIEGTAERILLPEMIKKTDALDATLKLGSQYLAVLEIGGAYSYKFFDLLDFLELQTLIVTDIDSVFLENSKWKACHVTKGGRTSNETLKTWFEDKEISPTALLAKTVEEKTQGIRRIAFQIPHSDGSACARSFEDSFILANHPTFELNNTDEIPAYELAAEQKKSDFAVKYAIDHSDWVVPKYIEEGLQWLAKRPVQQEVIEIVE